MKTILVAIVVAVLFACFGLFHRRGEGAPACNACPEHAGSQACAACERGPEEV